MLAHGPSLLSLNETTKSARRCAVVFLVEGDFAVFSLTPPFALFPHREGGGRGGGGRRQCAPELLMASHTPTPCSPIVVGGRGGGLCQNQTLAQSKKKNAANYTMYILWPCGEQFTADRPMATPPPRWHSMVAHWNPNPPPPPPFGGPVESTARMNILCPPFVLYHVTITDMLILLGNGLFGK